MFKAIVSVIQWTGILFIVLIFVLIVLAGAKIQKRRKRDKKEIDTMYDLRDEIIMEIITNKSSKRTYTGIFSLTL